MNIVYYRYNYEYFTNILSLKMEIRDGSLSLYESIFSRLFNVGVIDRTKELPKALNSIVLYQIPSYLDKIDSYSDIVLDNANKIKSSLSLQPMMYYDGSIDATVSLLGLIDAGVSDILLNVSESTFKEQEDFIKSLNLEYKINDKIEYGEDIKHYNIISYGLGKVINDCDFIYNISNDQEWLNLDYNEFTTYLKSLLISDKYNDAIEEQMEFIYSLSPVQLSNVYSAIKWVSFNLAYQGLTFEGWYDNKTIWRAKETVKNFYNTDKFQRYALKNIDKVYLEEDFKKDAVDYINSKTKLYNNTNKFVKIDDQDSDLRFIRDDFKPFRDIGID